MRRIDTGAVNIRIDVAGVIVCLLATGAVFLLGFEPLIDRESQHMARRNAVAQRHRQIEQSTATLTMMRSHLVKVRHAIKESAIQLQPSSNLNRRVAQITDLATRSGLAVHEIQPGTIVSGDRYDTVPIQLGGQGTYESCARFLSQLHEAFGDTGVSSLEMTGTPAAPAQPAAFRLSLTWYAAPRPAATASAAQ